MVGRASREEDLQSLKDKNFSIQIHCFKGALGNRKIKRRPLKSEARGERIPGTRVLQLNMDTPSQAQEEWPDVMRTTYNHLYQGDSAYIRETHQVWLNDTSGRGWPSDPAMSQAATVLGAPALAVKTEPG